jgi:hypothetical protein
MILVKHIWNKILDEVEKYGIKDYGTDVRFIFLVYTYYMNRDNYSLIFQQKKLIRQTYKNFYEYFVGAENVSFATFTRSLYRAINKVENGNDDLFTKLKSICKKIDEEE